MAAKGPVFESGAAVKAQAEHDRMRQLLRSRSAATLLLMNKEKPVISGELLVLKCGYVTRRDVKRWVNLDPDIGLLSIWKEQPPNKYMPADDLMLARSNVWLCGTSMRHAACPSALYKLFDLTDVDCNQSYRNIFLRFQNPHRVLVLTAPSPEEFSAWFDALSRYVEADHAGPDLIVD
eukprot:TRINITY_DN79091_c0_g1_i1.p1 TRINITY_DN79091_c0_g1~~TRINITY_DN79091_c0_g1_i1.p1  ORF type:complete len:178 (-),score=26.35 TRINITY_DN79091_c0_g1_i1:73-606(-)